MRSLELVSLGPPTRRNESLSTDFLPLSLSSTSSISPSSNPYPSYLISPFTNTSPRQASHKQVVHLVPTSSTSLPPRRLPSELLALSVDDPGASTPFGWEAIFEPALVVGVRGSSNSWGRTLVSVEEDHKERKRQDADPSRRVASSPHPSPSAPTSSIPRFTSPRTSHSFRRLGSLDPRILWSPAEVVVR